MGAGAREHAMGWALSQSPEVSDLFFSPGNSGTAQLGENLPMDFSNPEILFNEAMKRGVDMVAMGRFTYIRKGVGEIFINNGIPVFGPSLAAAQVENSKVFSKKLLNDLGIPNAKAFIAYDLASATKYVLGTKYPLVLKTDGPVSGIGVEIVNNPKQAKKFLKDCFIKKKFQSDGQAVIIEEFLEGVEVSAHAFCDGKMAIMLPFSQDYKRLKDRDVGPNTDGIGSVAPCQFSDANLLEDIKNRAIVPILNELKKRGTPFVGVMYLGVMVGKFGWNVLEINARFGDPECQSYLALLKTDLAKIMKACTERKLNKISLEWSEGYACSLVLSTKNYSKTRYQGKIIKGLQQTNEQNQVIIFHGETKIKKDQPVTDGPRVVCITAAAPTLPVAISKAYEKVGEIKYRGKYFRKDIGQRTLLSFNFQNKDRNGLAVSA